MSREVRALLESTLSSWPVLERHILHLYDSRIFHFYLVGGAAACLHIFLAWLLTEFVFGLSRYYVGYFIGMGISWGFSFVMHVLLTFKAKDRLAVRWAGFLAHSVVTNVLQAWLVTTLTDYLGKEYYLIVITLVIFAISLATYFVYKHLVFAKFSKPIS